jgi:hypothetical protein
MTCNTAQLTAEIENPDGSVYQKYSSRIDSAQIKPCTLHYQFTCYRHGRQTVADHQSLRTVPHSYLLYTVFLLMMA